MKKTILLTNDDGYLSYGLKVLRKELNNDFRVITVAPDREKSAISMALTLNEPLRVKEIENDFYIVNGTPSDCVNIAIRKILKQKPDLVISGMNIGENLSEDIFYSGTFAGALSGYLFDISSVAISLISNKSSYSEGDYDFERGAAISKVIVEKVLEIKEKYIFNVNIPFNDNGMILKTKFGFKRYNPDIIENIDPRGGKYYWIGTGKPVYDIKEGNDIWAVRNGYVSLTVFKPDLKRFNYEIEELNFDKV